MREARCCGSHLCDLTLWPPFLLTVSGVKLYFLIVAILIFPNCAWLRSMNSAIHHFYPNWPWRGLEKISAQYRKVRMDTKPYLHTLTLMNREFDDKAFRYCNRKNYDVKVGIRLIAFYVFYNLLRYFAKLYSSQLCSKVPISVNDYLIKLVPHK